MRSYAADISRWWRLGVPEYISWIGGAECLSLTTTITTVTMGLPKNLSFLRFGAGGQTLDM